MVLPHWLSLSSLVPGSFLRTKCEVVSYAHGASYSSCQFVTGLVFTSEVWRWLPGSFLICYRALFTN